MPEHSTDDVRECDRARLLPIVVGAHLEAEHHDRPMAGELADAIAVAMSPDAPLAPLVLTDLWYLNDPPLRQQPTIAIGRPEVNAASAFLAGKVPTALLVDHRFRIQLDPELIELGVCLWGVSPATTAEAIRTFIERYLDEYVDAVRTLMPAG